jgi:anti-sigma factor RsiW
MTCAQAQQLIEPYFDNELDANLTAAVQEHLLSCASCAENHRQLENLRMAIQTHVPRYQPPARLQAQVEAAVRSVAVTQRRTPPWQWMAMAASFLLAVSLAWNVALLRTRNGSGNIMTQTVLASHVRSLIGSHLLDVPSADQHTVKPWFNGKLDFSPDVKDFNAQGFPLVGGRIDYLADRPVAALVYQRRLHVINVFTWPSPSPNSHEVEVRLNGYGIRHWAKSGMTYWAVSDLNPNELGQFEDLYRK